MTREYEIKLIKKNFQVDFYTRYFSLEVKDLNSVLIGNLFAVVILH